MPVVKLNVGGHKFMTTLKTLKSRGRNNLVAMLENDKSGRIKTVKEADGFYFVDRNPKLFETVLEYLRTGMLILPSTDQERQQLKLEFEFYGVEPVFSTPEVPPFFKKVAAEPDFASSLNSLPSEEMQQFLDQHWDAELKPNVLFATRRGKKSMTACLVPKMSTFDSQREINAINYSSGQNVVGMIRSVFYGNCDLIVEVADEKLRRTVMGQLAASLKAMFGLTVRIDCESSLDDMKLYKFTLSW